MKRFAWLIIVLVLIGGGSYLWYSSALQPVNAMDQTKDVVKIPKGTSASQVAKLLQEQGIIRSSLAFRIFSRIHGKAGGLQAGSFVLSPSMNVEDVISAIAGGKAAEFVITIPEGFTVKDIDSLLASKQLIDTGALLTCAENCDFSTFSFLPKSNALAPRGGKLEGYLFPETYFVVADGFDPKSFLERMLTIFQKRVIEGMAADLKSSKRSLSQIVTMASLIERETKSDEERPTVAGILWKRLDAKTGLGVDAAIRYILEKPTEPLTTDDLQINSPYNLRKFRGLPPGPIGSPSEGSIRAALHPSDTKYWYYLHDKNGVVHYAETNDEHNSNKALYMR